MSQRSPTQEEVARVLEMAIKTVDSIEDDLGEMSQEQRGMTAAALMGFWRAIDMELHGGMTGDEFKQKFQSFVEGYLTDHFSEGKPSGN